MRLAKPTQVPSTLRLTLVAELVVRVMDLHQAQGATA